MIGTFENERIAEKLRNLVAYYGKGNKTPKAELKNELAEIKRSKISPLGLIPNTLITIGITLIVICMLALRRKKKGN